MCVGCCFFVALVLVRALSALMSGFLFLRHRAITHCLFLFGALFSLCVNATASVAAEESVRSALFRDDGSTLDGNQVVHIAASSLITEDSLITEEVDGREALRAEDGGNIDIGFDGDAGVLVDNFIVTTSFDSQELPGNFIYKVLFLEGNRFIFIDGEEGLDGDGSWIYLTEADGVTATIRMNWSGGFDSSELQLVFSSETAGSYTYTEGEGEFQFVASGDFDLGAVAGPSSEMVTALLPGLTINETFYTSATRFNWNGLLGNWSYESAAPNVGILTQTFDEDGNNPNVYRDESILIFDSATTGRYVYSEYVDGILWYSESGTFDFPWLASTPIWEPQGWVYFAWPYAYSFSEERWHFFNASDTQWRVDLSNGQWEEFSDATGWNFYTWPYSYSSDEDAWYWYSNNTQWVVDLISGVWSLLGESGD